jgi:hypothetical protein
VIVILDDESLKQMLIEEGHKSGYPFNRASPRCIEV